MAESLSFGDDDQVDDELDAEDLDDDEDLDDEDADLEAELDEDDDLDDEPAAEDEHGQEIDQAIALIDSYQAAEAELTGQVDSLTAERDNLRRENARLKKKMADGQRSPIERQVEKDFRATGRTDPWRL